MLEVLEFSQTRKIKTTEAYFISDYGLGFVFSLVPICYSRRKDRNKLVIFYSRI